MERRPKLVGLKAGAIAVALEVEKCRCQQRLPTPLLVGFCARQNRRANISGTTSHAARARSNSDKDAMRPRRQACSQEKTRCRWC